MTANEMFEKLGYEERDGYEDRIVYRSTDGSILIVFELSIKEFNIAAYANWNWVAKNISIEEYQAITQQLKELGWIE